MAEKFVSDLEVDASDAAGVKVRTIYARNPPSYAVYRAVDRIMVQFADSEMQARRQRAALLPLNALRGEISGLIDDWQASNNRQLRAKAERFHRRIADALIVGLQGDAASAQAGLQAIKDDLLAERKSWARFQYLIIASAVGGAMLLLLGIAALINGFAISPTNDAGTIMLATGAGIVGAFFSIAIGIRSRTVLTDLQRRDNASDAVLRIVIGAIAAALIFCMFLSKLVTVLQIDQAAIRPGTKFSWSLVVVIGFVAGFFERLVPDLLAKANFGSTAEAEAAALPKAQVAAATVAVAAENAAEDADEAEPRDDDHEDNCLCDVPSDEEDDAELTADEDLPVTSGGVQPGERVPA